MSGEQSPVCREHFERTDARLRELEAARGELAVLTGRMHERLNTIDVSLKSLIRALWGVTGSVLAALLGFVLWYIQGGHI